MKNENLVDLSAANGFLKMQKQQKLRRLSASWQLAVKHWPAAAARCAKGGGAMARIASITTCLPALHSQARPAPATASSFASAHGPQTTYARDNMAHNFSLVQIFNACVSMTGAPTRASLQAPLLRNVRLEKRPGLSDFV
jgi:hypothetical protein